MTNEIGTNFFLWMMQYLFLRVFACLEAWLNAGSEQENG